MIVDIFNTDKKYDIIYADPPWRYRFKRSTRWGGMTYPTLPVEEICKFPVQNIASKNCILFLWITYPQLPKAFKVIDAWGFTYKTVAFTWVKQNPKSDGIYSGIGSWTNGNAEICLLATKGHPKRIAKNIKQIILSHVRRHSQKPDEARERIVALMGDLPRIELFAREVGPGWDAWGNEVSEI